MIIDGHNFDEIVAALETARSTKDKPTAIIAKTFKGRGIEGVEDQDNWHGKPVDIKTVSTSPLPSNPV